MKKTKIIFAITSLICCFICFPILFGNTYLKMDSQRISDSKHTAILTTNPTHALSTIDSSIYHKFIDVPATNYMPHLSFELTGISKRDVDYGYFYYPVKLVVKADNSKIQEIDFKEGDFAPCTIEDFGFEYGDYKFDGYGGFRILSTSMGKNASYYFWLWDKDKKCFVKYPDLEIIGYVTFDYSNKLVNVSNMDSGSKHEFITYKYLNSKLTLIKKVIDADDDGYRKVYELINGEMRLIETTKSQLK